MTDRIWLYDTTLRDGAQTGGVDFSALDKAAIARELDALGIDYIEGGWPGANPTDDAFFADAPKLARATLTAFGMTRRPGRSAANDPGLAALTGAGTGAVCIVGKTWDFHVDVALEIPREENLALISDSIAHLNTQGIEPHFDAEHFFDGYKANPDYALSCIRAAHDAGARWITLCDTNGGTLPHEVERIVREVAGHIPGEQLGIHTHDDTGNAVANSLAAVRGGARLVQGTLNGLGERCGNANLVSIIPSLMLKMGFDTGPGEDGLKRLTHASRFLDERLNRAPDRHAAYVGENAFAHKGGLHVSAVAKDPKSYEHVPPEAVGNARKILVSDQAGKSNILARFEEIGLVTDPASPKVARLIEEVKLREHQGYAYDGAEASFELLARRMTGTVPEFFTLASFRVMDERRADQDGTVMAMSEATIKLIVNDERLMTVAEGNGPVNALDAALRTALKKTYPELEELRLVDYKVRILTPGEGTRAVTRVMIETAARDGTRWSTVGVSANIIDASFMALHDSITWALLHRAELKAAAE